jgi:hypothetical protein
LGLTNFLRPNISRDVATCWVYAFQKMRGYKVPVGYASAPRIWARFSGQPARKHYQCLS